MKKPDLKNLENQAQANFLRYKLIIFVVFVALIYGYVLIRYHTLSTAQPTLISTSKSQTSSLPNIDSATVKQIQQLQDNSVSVQTLFNQARQNPFQ